VNIACIQLNIKSTIYRPLPMIFLYLIYRNKIREVIQEIRHIKQPDNHLNKEIRLPANHLINSVLTSLVMFMLSFFEIPRGVLERIDCFRSGFFWQGGNHKKKYRLARWDILCQPKDQGGLGIQNIDVQNKCLLSKWLFKLINEDGMWQRLLRNKYLERYPLSKVKHRPSDSHFWSGLMKVKDTFLNLGNFILKNGE
jgi:hypothetical protein